MRIYQTKIKIMGLTIWVEVPKTVPEYQVPYTVKGVERAMQGIFDFVNTPRARKVEIVEANIEGPTE